MWGPDYELQKDRTLETRSETRDASRKWAKLQLQQEAKARLRRGRWNAHPELGCELGDALVLQQHRLSRRHTSAAGKAVLQRDLHGAVLLQPSLRETSSPSRRAARSQPPYLPCLCSAASTVRRTGRLALPVRAGLPCADECYDVCSCVLARKEMTQS